MATDKTPQNTPGTTPPSVTPTQDQTYIRPCPDFNSSQRLTPTLLDERSYITWAIDAKTALKGKGLLSFADGTRPRPT